MSFGVAGAAQEDPIEDDSEPASKKIPPGYCLLLGSRWSELVGPDGREITRIDRTEPGLEESFFHREVLAGIAQRAAKAAPKAHLTPDKSLEAEGAKCATPVDPKKNQP